MARRLRVVVIEKNGTLRDILGHLGCFELGAESLRDAVGRIPLAEASPTMRAAGALFG